MATRVTTRRERVPTSILMSVTVSISFDESLLADIDKLAKRERRSRSELIQEAVRLHVERKKRWNRILALGQATTKSKGLSKRDVTAEIRAHRKSKAARQ